MVKINIKTHKGVKKILTSGQKEKNKTLEWYKGFGITDQKEIDYFEKRKQEVETYAKKKGYLTTADLDYKGEYRNLTDEEMDKASKNFKEVMLPIFKKLKKE